MSATEPTAVNAGTRASLVTMASRSQRWLATLLDGNTRLGLKSALKRLVAAVQLPAHNQIVFPNSAVVGVSKGESPRIGITARNDFDTRSYWTGSRSRTQIG